MQIILSIEILTIDRTEKLGPDIPDNRADPEILTGQNSELISVAQKWVRVILDYRGVSDQSSKQEVIQMLSFHGFTGCINYVILWRFDICQKWSKVKVEMVKIVRPWMSHSWVIISLNLTFFIKYWESYSKLSALNCLKFWIFWTFKAGPCTWFQ